MVINLPGAQFQALLIRRSIQQFGTAYNNINTAYTELYERDEMQDLFDLADEGRDDLR